MLFFVLPFLAAFLVAVFLTPVIGAIMRRCRAVDAPRGDARKIYKKRIPLGGGLAIAGAFFLVAGAAAWFGVFGHTIHRSHLFGLLLGSVVLFIGGYLDDRFQLRPIQQIWFPVIAALLFVWFGTNLDAITNPFGTVVRLDRSFFIAAVTFGDIVVFFWLIGMMYTTKLLDGLDGLVAGVVAIGAMMIFFLTLQTQWYEPEVAFLAIVLAGSLLGFLVWNWHPARIFLGEGGSVFTGFVLGALAIISGGKIATTLLVVGLPMLDVVRVLFLRIKHRKPIFSGDKEHLHFLLLDSGLGHKQTVLLFYAIAVLFGATALFLQSSQKLVALVFLAVLMILFGVRFSRTE